MSKLHLLLRSNAVTRMTPMFRDADATRLLAVSPHLDDAVLSFGAGLAQAAQDGAKVTVYTVFAGAAPPPYSAAAERMHAVWGLSPNDDAPLYRRKEDIAALDHLGVDYRHGRFPDANYRTLPDGRWLVELVENADGGHKLVVHQQSPESSRDLVSAIKGDVRAIIEECDPTLLVTCAAIGNHADHEMARDAALLAAHETGVPIRLWEDLPYAAFRRGAVELPQGFQLGPSDFSSVGTDVRTRKFQAVEHYPSQLSMFKGSDTKLFDRLDEHARKASPHGGYGETTWPVVRNGDDS